VGQLEFLSLGRPTALTTQRVVYVALAGNLLVTATKLTAALWTGCRSNCTATSDRDGSVAGVVAPGRRLDEI